MLLLTDKMVVDSGKRPCLWDVNKLIANCKLLDKSYNRFCMPLEFIQNTWYIEKALSKIREDQSKHINNPIIVRVPINSYSFGY